MEMEMEMSKTQEALQLIRDKGLTPYAAAKEVGITPTTLYAAIKREESKKAMDVCPCCGQVVREGFEIDRGVLKE
jgi:predicted DNA-binding protein (UPF0251 family)